MAVNDTGFEATTPGYGNTSLSLGPRWSKHGQNEHPGNKPSQDIKDSHKTTFLFPQDIEENF